MRNKFLHSKEWLNLRQLALQRDNNQCFLCGTHDNLVVHHIRYRRFAKDLKDKLFNLICLCKSCHYKVHKSSGNIELALKLNIERPDQLRQLINQNT